MRQSEKHDGSFDHLMTVAEVAEITGTSPASIYRDIAARKITVYRLRGQIRIDASSLAEYLERHRQPSLETIKPNRNHF
ncbi:helix-turn-helix domain-containing protein [Rhodopirellula europaea]|uniref:helix-turn-helix domain-containing protein n=1 Tax=Rhodopirellula europaea TaxID=1263866 RepID=UPI003D2AEBA2